ncbi:MAG: hypothetical protein QOD10_197 [Mycobacterium sp.]|jgi:hypothetical protein|nr:hypothetical protein [Mycobacterium sp.]
MISSGRSGVTAPAKRPLPWVTDQIMLAVDGDDDPAQANAKMRFNSQ